MKPAERSSWWTWTRMRASAARASAIGVEREPGADDGVGHAAADPLVDERGAERRGDVGGVGHRPQGRARPCDAGARAARRAVRGRVAARAGARLHPDRGVAGARSPTASRRDHEVVARRPARPRRGRPTCGPGCGRRRPLVADGRRTGDLRRLLDGRPGRRCTSPSPHPELVERLVLVGATAGIDDADERAERRAADEALADRSRQIGVDAFLDEWLAQPLFAGLPAEAAGLEDRRHEHRRRAGRRPAPRRAPAPGPAAVGPPRPSSTMPVLVVAGERDAKFRRLGARLVRSIGANAELIVVGDAGHAVPFEQPESFADAVRRWFDAIEAFPGHGPAEAGPVPEDRRSGGDGEAGGEEDAEDELDPAGRGRAPG